MLANVKICENGLANLSENLKDVEIKLLEMTRFATNQFSLILHVFGVRCDRVKFSENSPFIENFMHIYICIEN